MAVVAYYTLSLNIGRLASLRYVNEQTSYQEENEVVPEIKEELL